MPCNCWVAYLLSFCFVCLRFHKAAFGRILGTVTDQSGGVISGATVTVIDTERGVIRTLTTDDAGAYNAPNLTPGNYTVRVEATGFKKLRAFRALGSRLATKFEWT